MEVKKENSYRKDAVKKLQDSINSRGDRYALQKNGHLWTINTLMCSRREQR